MNEIFRFPSSFPLGERRLGAGQPCYFIAEVAQAHDGSLGLAHSFIDAAADAGADAVKFQTHIAAAESTRAEKFRVPFATQDATRYAYWKRLQFTEGQWRELFDHARGRGLTFLSSPFSAAAVELLERLGVPAWKIGSGETNNLPLLKTVLATGKPILLSSGMSYFRELDAAVGLIREAHVPLAVLQCTSRYPCPPEQVGLNLLPEFQERYQCPVGLSDHSGQTAVLHGAVTLGAKVIEVHVTFHPQMFGPDVSSSLTFEELAAAITGARFLEKALGHPVNKDKEAERLAEMRSFFTKSIVAQRNLPQGTILAREDLDFKKPGTGIPAAEVEEVLGKKLRRGLKQDEMLSWNDLAEV
jgi:N,N'-diacetyllegionaminate synthase